jgi:hypothetical protein
MNNEPADESFDRTASHMAGEYVSSPTKTLTNKVYFCSCCGKRLGNGIHTCTPPADILRKAEDK